MDPTVELPLPRPFPPLALDIAQIVVESAASSHRPTAWALSLVSKQVQQWYLGIFPLNPFITPFLYGLASRSDKSLFRNIISNRYQREQVTAMLEQMFSAYASARLERCRLHVITFSQSLLDIVDESHMVLLVIKGCPNLELLNIEDDIPTSCHSTSLPSLTRMKCSFTVAAPFSSQIFQNVRYLHIVYTAGTNWSQGGLYNMKSLTCLVLSNALLLVDHDLHTSVKSFLQELPQSLELLVLHLYSETVRDPMFEPLRTGVLDARVIPCVHPEFVRSDMNREWVLIEDVYDFKDTLSEELEPFWGKAMQLLRSRNLSLAAA